MTISHSKALKNFLEAGGSLRQALQGGIINVYSGSAPANADAAVTGSLLFQICDYSGARGGETLAQGTANYTGSAGGQIATLTVNGVSVIGAAVNNTGVTLSALMAVLAAKINTFASVPDYSAVAGPSSVTIVARPGTGAGPNGFVVTGTIAQAATMGSMAGGVTAVARVDASGTVTFTSAGPGAFGIDGYNSADVSWVSSLTQMATDYKNAINAAYTGTSPNYYQATSSGATITVKAIGTGALYNGYTAGGWGAVGGLTETDGTFSGGVNQVVEVKSSFQIDLNGAGAGGMTQISALTVNAVSIINAAVNYNTSDSQTATDLAASINTKVSSPDYTATAVGTVVTIQALAGTGAGPNGFLVKITCAPSLAIGSFVNMAGGAGGLPITFTLETRATGTMTLTGGGAGNTVNTVTVNGVDLLGGIPVAYNASLAQTAADIVTQINQSQTSPEYTARSSGAVVTITAGPGTGAGANGLVVSASLTGVTATFANMSGGVSSVNGLKFAGTALSGMLQRLPSQFWYAAPAASATPGYFRFVTANADAGGADSAETFIRVQGTVGDQASGADMKLLKGTYGPEQSIAISSLLLTA
jgi:hypothetical protein